MSSWRDTILNEFIPDASKLTLVTDPDNLLTEEKLALQLRQRGFELIEFNDPVEFRYAYEAKYRSIWDSGEHTNLVVILRLQDTEMESLPYDLLKAGRRLPQFSLANIFLNFSPPVIESLDRSFLDELYNAQIRFAPGRLGDNDTKDFVLGKVFKLSLDGIANEIDLLRSLLRLHYNKIQLPKALADRLVQVLKGHAGFHVWPLDEIVADEAAFYAFLQERWPVFLSRLGAADQVREGSENNGLMYPGPAVLPFEHQDIRVYIDNLFVEGKLTPVQMPEVAIDFRPWIRSGVIEVGVDDDAVRATRLFELVERGLPTAEFQHSDWTVFAQKWAELSALVHCGPNEEDKTRLRKMRNSLNATFANWLSNHYDSLITQSPSNPAMLHHIPRRLARDLEETKNNRVALLVVDGLALDQWVTIRQILQDQDSSLVMRESAIFAWIPTLTSVSRQSIFSGTQPCYFPSSINSTNSEGNLWQKFWEGVGLSRLDIAYQRGLCDGDVPDLLEAAIHPGKTRAVGLVVDKIDKIMHGMQLGSAGMHNQIKQWCKGGFLSSLIGYLLDLGFQVWMTSDHGNIECHGKGRPSEGVIAETRGERVRIYPTPELRSQVACNFPFACEWQSGGLPAGFYPLVAQGNYAFVKEGEVIVGHGGCSIEEVIVPLVKFERNARR